MVMVIVTGSYIGVVLLYMRCGGVIVLRSICVMGKMKLFFFFHFFTLEEVKLTLIVCNKDVCWFKT